MKSDELEEDNTQYLEDLINKLQTDTKEEECESCAI